MPNKPDRTVVTGVVDWLNRLARNVPGLSHTASKLESEELKRASKERS